jgi:hypothetical protein
MLFKNKYQQAANPIIRMIVFCLDLVVLIGIPVYTFTQYGIGSAIVMVPVSLFIISPIVTFLSASIGAILMIVLGIFTKRHSI